MIGAIVLVLALSGLFVGMYGGAGAMYDGQVPYKRGSNRRNAEKKPIEKRPIEIEKKHDGVVIYLRKSVPLGTLELLSDALKDANSGEIIQDLYQGRANKRKAVLTKRISNRIEKMNSLNLENTSLSDLEKMANETKGW